MTVATSARGEGVDVREEQNLLWGQERECGGDGGREVRAVNPYFRVDSV
jgi:hypothetical protein